MKALCMDNIVDLEAAFMLQAEQIDVCARAKSQFTCPVKVVS